MAERERDKTPCNYRSRTSTGVGSPKAVMTFAYSHFRWVGEQLVENLSECKPHQ
jgi:hypothetical protein